MSQDDDFAAWCKDPAHRTTFLLDEKAWQAFMEALDRPPADNPRLSELLSRRSVFEA
jgi:uncharacterized protein (DUF1778 family)